MAWISRERLNEDLLNAARQTPRHKKQQLDNCISNPRRVYVVQEVGYYNFPILVCEDKNVATAVCKRLNDEESTPYTEYGYVERVVVKSLPDLETLMKSGVVEVCVVKVPQ